MGSIPDQGVKIPCVSWPKNQKHKIKQYHNKFNKGLKKNDPHQKEKKNYLQKETLMGFTHRNCREREYTQKLLKKINITRGITQGNRRDIQINFLYSQRNSSQHIFLEKDPKEKT